MTDRDPEPRWDRIPDPHERKRVRTTISCTDADALPKVADAGVISMRGDVSVQTMHNGLLIIEGCYDGAWMTEIIRSLHGHHEPQEEVAFDAIVRRLADEGAGGRMIELGAYWSYYSMWFAAAVPDSSVIAMEPDPNNLDVGRRNVALNGLSDRIHFVHGAIGDRPGELLRFVNESDGKTVTVPQFDLPTLAASQGWDRIDLLLADIQGAESLLIELERARFRDGLVRFLLVSTHHNSISGDPLTHQHALADLRALGAHVIAEHSIPESFSGDGLIVVSFDERDRDLVVPVSFARARDSLFDELEWELARAVRSSQETAAAARALDRIRSSPLWVWSAPARRVYSRARRIVSARRSRTES